MLESSMIVTARQLCVFVEIPHKGSMAGPYIADQH